jgi:hypothetical protein
MYCGEGDIRWHYIVISHGCRQTTAPGGTVRFELPVEAFDRAAKATANTAPAVSCVIIDYDELVLMPCFLFSAKVGVRTVRSRQARKAPLRRREEFTIVVESFYYSTARWLFHQERTARLVQAPGSTPISVCPSWVSPAPSLSTNKSARIGLKKLLT